MPIAPYDPYAPVNPWWQQQQAPQQGAPFSQPPSANSAKQQPSLYDMMLNLGRMTRPQYDKAISGPGAYGISPQIAATAGPWEFLVFLLMVVLGFCVVCGFVVGG
jgi:hypothetical protein